MVVGNKSTRTTMEEMTITLPNLINGVTRIGELWDCRASKAVGENIFDQNALEGSQDFLEFVPVHDMQYELTRVRNASGKAELLSISMEVAFELAGSISVEGAASFTKEREKKFDEEEFFCKYDIQTFLVRTRPSVSDPSKNVIHDSVKKRILEGTIKPTHFVSEISLGGQTIASLRISDDLKHDNLELSGMFGGALPLGPIPITVGIKASIAFQTQESSSNYSSKILITQLPPPPEGGKPTTNIMEMFELVEQLPENIKNSTSYLQDEGIFPVIKGVPITFKLSPITHLFHLEPESGYALLEAEVLKQFNEMIFTLVNFDLENAYQNLLREIDPRLIYLFPKIQNQKAKARKPNENWAEEVTNYQKEKQSQGSITKSQALDTMNSYKHGAASMENIMEILDDYRSNFNYPGILERSKIDADEGRSILAGLHLIDATDCDVSPLFLFSEEEFRDVELNKKNPSFILQTNGVGPQGTHTNFYSIAYFMKSLAVSVRVACPHISTDFSLSLNVLDVEDVKFYGEDITFALNILKQINFSKIRTFTAFTTYINLASSELLNELTIDQFGEWINRIKLKLKPCKFAETYLQTLEAIGEFTSDEKIFTLLFPLQYPLSSWDSFSAYRKLNSEFQNNIGGLISTFDIGSITTVAPSVIVLDRIGFVIGICMDNLDHLLLLKGLGNNAKAMELLHPKNLEKFNFTSIAANSCKDFANQLGYISTADYEKQRVQNPFEVKLLTEEENHYFDSANLVLALSLGSPIEQLVNAMYSKTDASSVYNNKLSPIMKKFGWSDQQGFPSGADWNTLITELKKAMEELQKEKLQEEDQSADLNLLNLLIYTTSYAEQGGGGYLKNVVFYFMEKFLKTKDGELLRQLQEVYDNKELIPVKIAKLSRLFQVSRYNKNFRKLSKNIYELESLDDAKEMISFIEMVKEFSTEEAEWVISNPKIIFWLESFNQNKKVMAKIYELFYQEDTLPSWMPPLVKSSMKQIMEYNSTPKILWDANFQNLEVLLESFRYIVEQGVVPQEFTFVLQDAFLKNKVIFELFKEKGCLFYWNEDIEKITNFWGIYSIKSALDILTSTSSEDNEELKKRIIPSKLTTNLNQGHLDLPTSTLAPVLFRNTRPEDHVLENLLSHIRNHVRHGNSSVLSFQSVASYFGYSLGNIQPPLKGIEPKENTYDANRKFINFISLPFSSCFTGNPSNYIPLNTQEDSIRKTANIFTRDALLSSLLEGSDFETQFQILNELTQTNQFALPWFVYHEHTSTWQDFSEVLKLIKITSVARNIFENPFKLIVCLRIGSRRNETFGKSTILNGLTSHCQFASKFEPGFELGLPIKRNAIIELLWLNKETTSLTFQEAFLNRYSKTHKDPVLLANIHGDFNSHNFSKDVLKDILTHANSIIVFWEVNNWNEYLNENLKFMHKIEASVPTFSLFLDPDATILAKVEPSMIINTNEEYSKKIIKTMENVLLLSAPHPKEINGKEKSPALRDFLTFLQTYSAAHIRNALKLQDTPKCNLSIHWQDIVDPDKNHLWGEALSFFFEILQQNDMNEIFKLQQHLRHISSTTTELLTNEVEILRTKLTKDNSSLAKLKSTIKKVEQFQKNWLSPTNFFTELNIYTELEGNDNRFNGYEDHLKAAFLSGIPLSMHPIGNEVVNSALAKVEHKILTIALLNFAEAQQNFFKKIVTSLFGVEIEPNIGNNCQTMQYISCKDEMKQRFGLDPEVQGILLIIDQPGAPERNPSEKQSFTSILLSSCDLCILVKDPVITQSFKNNWSNVLKTAMMLMSLQKNQNRSCDFLLVQESRKLEDLPVDKEEYEFFNLLQSVESFVQENKVNGGFQKSILETADQTLKNLFDETAIISISSDEGAKKDIEALQIVLMNSLRFKEGRHPSNWYQDVITANNTSMNEVQTLNDLEAYKITQSCKNTLNTIKTKFEDAFKKHRDLIVNSEEPIYSKEITNIFKNAPFFCTYKNLKETCICSEICDQVAELQQQEEIVLSLSQKESFIDEMNSYNLYLRNSLIDLLVPTSDINFKLSFTLKECFLQELREEYGNKFLQEVLAWDNSLENIFAYDVRHESEVLEILVGKKEDQLVSSRLKWETAAWLEVQILSLAKWFLQEDIYQHGIVRYLRGKLDSLLQEEFNTLYGYEEIMHLNFFRDIHVFAANNYLKMLENI